MPKGLNFNPSGSFKYLLLITAYFFQVIATAEADSAVMSGMQTSRAITGFPKKIQGETDL